MAYNSHGHTPAAWTTVIIVFVAFVVGAIAVVTLNWSLFWGGGVGLVVAGCIVGKVMQMMGLGQTYPQPTSPTPQAASEADSPVTVEAGPRLGYSPATVTGEGSDG